MTNIDLMLTRALVKKLHATAPTYTNYHAGKLMIQAANSLTTLMKAFSDQVVRLHELESVLLLQKAEIDELKGVLEAASKELMSKVPDVEDGFKEKPL